MLILMGVNHLILMNPTAVCEPIVPIYCSSTSASQTLSGMIRGNRLVEARTFRYLARLRTAETRKYELNWPFKVQPRPYQP